MMYKVLRHNLDEGTITVMLADGDPEDEGNDRRLQEDVPVMNHRDITQVNTDEDGNQTVEIIGTVDVPFEDGITERLVKFADDLKAADERATAAVATFKGAPKEGAVIKV